MVYTSTSLALAALELFVHLDLGDAPGELVSVSAEIPAGLSIERIAIEALPRDWRSIDLPALQDLGARWIAGHKSVAMEVPTVAVNGEWNVLLNPAHPDFGKIALGAPEAWAFDQRMFKSN